MLLAELLGEHSAALPNAGDLQLLVAVDPRGVTETIAALAPTQRGLQVQSRGDSTVDISIALPRGVEETTGAPLSALLASLQQYAGTPVATLAASQVLLERQGGTVRCEGGRRALLRLPLRAGRIHSR